MLNGWCHEYCKVLSVVMVLLSDCLVTLLVYSLVYLNNIVCKAYCFYFELCGLSWQLFCIWFALHTFWYTVISFNQNITLFSSNCLPSLEIDGKEHSANDRVKPGLVLCTYKRIDILNGRGHRSVEMDFTCNNTAHIFGHWPINRNYSAWSEMRVWQRQDMSYQFRFI